MNTNPTLRYLAVSLFMPALFSCSLLKKNSTSTILSSEFLNTPEFKVILRYSDLSTCTPEIIGSITIVQSPKKTTFYHSNVSQKVDQFSKPNIPVAQLLEKFEQKAKDPGTKQCGGYSGGNGILIHLKINDSDTHFSYCKDNWDGIAELTESIKNYGFK